jgi:hypothetical protein
LLTQDRKFKQNNLMTDFEAATLKPLVGKYFETRTKGDPAKV